MSDNEKTPMQGDGKNAPDKERQAAGREAFSDRRNTGRSAKAEAPVPPQKRSNGNIPAKRAPITPRRTAPDAKKKARSNPLPEIFHSKTPDCPWADSQKKIQKISAAVFAAVSLLLILLCTNLSYSYNGESIRVTSESSEATRSSSRAYRIVYSEADSFGLSSAEALRAAFLEKTGTSLDIVNDSESVSQHEIRIGHTNRASDDYLTSVSTLGDDGYAILITGNDSVNLLCFSETGADAAIKYFVGSYVGSYRHSKLTFANKTNFSFVSRSGAEPDVSLKATKVPLNFTESGKFKLLILSDADLNPNTIDAISRIADSEKPQLVIFAGDVSSGISTKSELQNYLKSLTEPLESRKIPWAAVFGEQDTDGGLSADAQMGVYTSFDYCVAKTDCLADGTISYFLPIYAHGGGSGTDAPIFGVFAMGQTSMLSSVSNGAATEALLSASRKDGTDYGYVTANQIAWFAETAKIADREGGGSLPSVMVCHTPTPEFEIAAKNPIETRLVGNIGESVAPSPINSGLFAALLDCGNVKGLYCGHDHLNSFSARYCDIELAYCASIGYDGYGLGGTFLSNNSLRGGRIIELTQKNEEISLSSRMVFAADLGVGTN